MGYLGGSRSAGCLAADAFSLVQKTHNRKNNEAPSATSIRIGPARALD